MQVCSDPQGNSQQHNEEGRGTPQLEGPAQLTHNPTASEGCSSSRHREEKMWDPQERCLWPHRRGIPAVGVTCHTQVAYVPWEATGATLLTEAALSPQPRAHRGWVPGREFTLVFLILG